MNRRACTNALATLFLITICQILPRGAVGSNEGAHGNSGTPIVAEAAHANSDDSAWIEDRQLLQGLLKEHACDRVWTTLWPWAKRGNMEARFLIFMLMVPPPDADFLRAPGNSGDYATTMRDALVMAVHSLDFDDHSSERAHYREVTVNLLRSIGRDDSPDVGPVLTCMRRSRTGCSEIAVKEMLVPSFDDYVRQIDALMNGGMTGSCTVVK